MTPDFSDFLEEPTVELAILHLSKPCEPCLFQTALSLKIMQAINGPPIASDLKMYTPQGFPDSSVGKESICNAGDPGSIPGSGRSAGEGIGYPLQSSWSSLVALLVKNLPAMWET